MNQMRQELYRNIVRLPLEKISKALSYIRFLEQEPETELYIDETEEKELQELLDSGDFVDDADVLAKIEALPND